METRLDTFMVLALGAFLAIFLGRTAHLYFVRGINPLHISKGKAPLDAANEALLVVALPVWLYEALAYAWPLPWHLFSPQLNAVVLDQPIARALGCLLIACGLFVFAASLVSFGDSWRVGIDNDTPGDLVTCGVFSITRNPIFLFMDAFTIGTFLVNGRLLFGVFAALTIGAIHMQIRREETFLTEHYGEAFLEYCRRTPRYLLARVC